MSNTSINFIGVLFSFFLFIFWFCSRDIKGHGWMCLNVLHSSPLACNSFLPYHAAWIPAVNHSWAAHLPSGGPTLSICSKSESLKNSAQMMTLFYIIYKPNKAVFCAFFFLWLHIFEILIGWCSPTRAALSSQWDWAVGWTAFGPDICGDSSSLVTAEEPILWETGLSPWSFMCSSHSRNDMVRSFSIRLG